MVRVTSLDGRVYEIDEGVLEKFRIPDEEVAKLKLPDLPAPPPVQGADQPSVRVRPGPGGSYIVDVVPPSKP